MAAFKVTAKEGSEPRPNLEEINNVCEASITVAWLFPTLMFSRLIKPRQLWALGYVTRIPLRESDGEEDSSFLPALPGSECSFSGYLSAEGKEVGNQAALWSHHSTQFLEKLQHLA